LEAQQCRRGQFRQEHGRAARDAHARKAPKIDRIAADGFETRFAALATHLPAVLLSASSRRPCGWTSYPLSIGFRYSSVLPLNPYVIGTHEKSKSMI